MPPCGVVLFLVLIAGCFITTVDAQCDQALGFENGNITDDQFSASSHYSSNAAHQARINGRGWSPSNSNSYNYLRVDLLTQHNVTRYAIQGSSIGWYTRTFSLYYSQDSYVWTKYITSEGDETLQGTTRWNSIAVFDMTPPVQARYLAFQSVSMSGYGGIGLELYGCQLENQLQVRRTQVSNHIDDTQEWLPSQSPYIVDTMINIRPSGHLKIQPGVQVIFTSSEAGLTVLGTLEARGLSGLPVDFRSSSPIINEPTKWKGIEVVAQGNLTLERTYVGGARTGIAGPLSTITLRHCHIHYNNQGLFLSSGDGQKDRIHLEFTRITNNVQRGVYTGEWDLESNYISMKNVDVMNNGHNGLEFKRDAVFNAENCRFSENRGSGMYNYWYGAVLNLKNCSFNGNSNRGLTFDYGRSAAFFNITITDSQFSNNRRDGLVLEIQRLMQASILIRNSKFARNIYHGLRLNGQYFSVGTVLELSNNTFDGASMQSNYNLLLMTFNSAHRFSVTIEDNAFTKGRGVSLQGNSKVSFTVRNNTFDGVNLGLALSSSSSGPTTVTGNIFRNCTKVIATGNPDIEISENVFINPQAAHDVSVSTTFSENVRIDLRRNYWGTVDKYQVRSRICDFFCDISKAIADVDPFYTSKDLIELSSSMDSHLFSDVDAQSAGGELKESVFLDQSTVLYVQRSIYVPRDIELVVPQNVTLIFPKKQGIYVRGTIRIQGTAEEPVSLEYGGGDNNKWGGIFFNNTESSLDHVSVVGAAYSILIKTNSSGTFNFSNLVFKDCNGYIYGEMWEDVTIHTDNVKVTNTRVPIQIKKMSTNHIQLYVSNSSFSTNEGTQLTQNIRGGSFHVNVLSSNFSSARETIYVSVCYTNASVLIHDSRITNTYRYKPLYLRANLLDVQLYGVTTSGDLSSSYVEACGNNLLNVKGIIDVQNSSFSTNRYVHALEIRNSNNNGIVYNVEVRQSSFTVGSNAYGLRVYSEKSTDQWNVLVEGNTFKKTGMNIEGGLENTTLAGNRITGASQSIYLRVRNQDANRTSVTENKVYGGTVTIISESATNVIDIRRNTFNGSQLVLQTASVDVKENSFLSGAEYDIKFNTEAFTGEEINCSLNYWGTLDDKAIGRRIYDDSYYPKYPTISFVPFYEYANMTSLIYPVQSFLASDGTIGGSVGGDVTLTRAGSPYTVTDNINVNSDDTLIIEPGVTLLFPKSLGINVLGTFKVNGEADSPVIARPLVLGEKWSGVAIKRLLYQPEKSVQEQIRLVGGKEEREGRVEVMVNGTWFTVCDDGFDRSDAAVACRMLGYDPTINHDVHCCAKYGQGTDPIKLSYLKCTGTEDSLMDCPWQRPSCSHGEDAGVKCYGDLLPPKKDREPEVQLRHFVVNDTENGLEINGNVTVMENVASSYASAKPALTINVGFNGVRSLDINGLETSNSDIGIAFTSDRQLGEKVKLAHVAVSKCSIHSNKRYGVSITHSVDLTVSNCNIERNSERGIFTQAEGSLNFIGVNFSQNKGFFLKNKHTSTSQHFNLWVKESEIRNHDIRYWRWGRWYLYNEIFEVTSGNCRACNFHFEDNIISNNFGTFIDVYLSQSSLGHTLYFANNTFINNNGSALVINAQRSTQMHLSFTRNSVTNTTLAGAALLYINSDAITANKIDISENEFTTNNLAHIIKLGDRRDTGENTKIERNVFQSNVATATVLTSVLNSTVRDNVFKDPDTGCELQVLPFERKTEINVQMNYWGSSEMSDIVKRICGFDGDMNKMFVEYLPCYLSEDKTEVSANRHTDFWTLDFNGGVVESMIEVPKSSAPYQITRSIYIRQNGTLVIKGGNVLQFHPKTGIYVDGVLTIEGGSDRVSLVPVNESWHGVVFPFKTAGVSQTVRLVNSSTPNEGRLEMFVQGQWLEVCTLGSKVVDRVCLALGYESSGRTWYDSNPSWQDRPVIYRVDCDAKAATLDKCTSTEPAGNSCRRSRVTCKDFVAHTGETRMSVLEGVNITNTVNGLQIQAPTVKISQSRITGTENTGILINTPTFELDFNGTVVEYGQQDGIVVNTQRSAKILNATSQHNIGNGLTIQNFDSTMMIEKIILNNNSKAGLQTELGSGGGGRTLHIKENSFQNHEGTLPAAKIRISMNLDDSILIDDNRFTNNSAGSLDADLPPYWRHSSSKIFYLKNNRFQSSGPLGITVYNDVSVYVEDNTFVNCTGHKECFLTIKSEESDSNNARNISVSTNSFEKTLGRCTARFESRDRLENNVFKYNQFYGSHEMEATVIVDSKMLSLEKNIFDNPDAVYELKVSREGDEVINAEHNWWGSADPEKAAARILHKAQDPRLIEVDYIPVLADQNFDCSAVNNCSQQGECVRPNGCRCDSGWAGADCTDYDCGGVGNCNKNGVCIGPNQCQCSDGWEGSSCVLATCHGVNDCGGDERGYCVLPDWCTCFPQFSGSDCSQCAQHRWGKSCLPCPKCKHGTCNTTNGECDCDSENWSGELCDSCSRAFYGPQCLPYINVLNVIPSSGLDTGGTDVHVWGHNFPKTVNDTFYCKFDSEVVPGKRLSNEHVVCKTPQHPPQEIYVEISSDGQEYTRNRTKFSFYAVCPPGACGKEESPPHGHCLYGGCVCILPWTGEGCNVELKAPFISPIEDSQAAEGDEYVLELSLTQGSEPISWYLYGAPAGMRIDPRSGRIYWERTVAAKDPYQLTVRASNRIGRSDMKWSLAVQLSYSASVDELSPVGPLPVPKSMLIKGRVTYAGTNQRSLVAFVDVKIRNKNRMSTVSVTTLPINREKFEAIYYPKAGDSGLFEVDARHPSETSFTPEMSWSVLGMKCEPGYVNRQAYLDTETVELRNVAVLKNVGVDTITGIRATVEGTGGPLSSVVVRVGDTLSTDTSTPLIDSMSGNSEMSFDLILTASRPLTGIIAVTFTGDEGTTARIRVRLQLNVRRPVLVLSPSSLSDSIPRASQKSFQINITNEGDVPATSLRVTLPTEPRLSLTAFSTERAQASEDGLTLESGETAVLVLTVTSGQDDALGEFRGSVALNSDLSATSFSYRFYVTSLDKLNVTVRVEDEYTYFASDKPLVSGAVVTLRNPRRGYREERVTTNETELALFEDVHEDQYTLTATAPGHGSYSAVIIAKPSESFFTIFLQRVAVKYTWTVTPTTFEDKYVITLDSTFETQVPMPVVTIEPININTIPFEEGKKDVINFNITNHGLIRADNVRFALPGNHPALIFTQTIDPIGAVEANTSIIVPVLVKPKTRVKRNLGQSACGLKMLYDYYCGGTRTGGQSVTLTRTYPGRPPLPCGGGGPSRGGSGPGYVGVSGTSGPSSSSSSSVVVYNPVTPLSCDCAGTLIKTCALGFHPIAGCALATVGLSGNSGFWGWTKAILDFGAACILTPLGAICPLCGLGATLWQAAWCIYESDRDCKSKRRRRAANSEVIQGLVDNTEPMRNYLIMLKEVFGGEDVFNMYDNSWISSFNLALSEESPAGSFLSQTEMSSISSSLNSTQRNTVEKFLRRWNKTTTAWEDGTLTSLGPKDDVISYNVIMTRFEQFQSDTDTAKQRGHGSIFDAFDDSVNVYKKDEEKAGKDDGVCAKVRVRIVQELVLTRDAFNAKLELENGELSALENIKVEVNIKATYGNGSSALTLFSIGSPKVVGITGVDGTGRLERDVSGTAEWLIIPYSTAAVKEDTLYDVGGTLSYTVDGSDFSIPLLPDTITVKPNPSLIVNYFHEKYVQGDDPMTSDKVEPVVPFTLAVMVSNGAYGVARQLKLTSGQPEIIENEKGLLVSFKIIGAQLGKNPVTPSLAINFGDIESFETKTARWLLTSSLRGKFYNFTATFENINPLGDPQLSILEHLGYHELVHLVRLEQTEDEFDDFLVNDVIDEYEMPDAVFDSSNGFYSSPVVAADEVKFTLERTVQHGKRKYVYTNLTVTVTVSTFEPYGYTRVVNNLTMNMLTESLLQVTREDGKNILIGYNAWQTDYYHDKFYLHVFDIYNSSVPITTSYSIVFGPRNMYAPSFASDEFEVTVSQNPPSGYVTTIQATDRDPDTTLEYSVTPDDVFVVDSNTGIITAGMALELRVYELLLTVHDDGIPSQNSSATVRITVTDGSIAPQSSTAGPGSTKTTPPTGSSMTTDNSVNMSSSVTTVSSITTGNNITTSSTLTVDHQSTSPAMSTATSPSGNTSLPEKPMSSTVDFSDSTLKPTETTVKTSGSGTKTFHLAVYISLVVLCFIHSI